MARTCPRKKDIRGQSHHSLSHIQSMQSLLALSRAVWVAERRAALAQAGRPPSVVAEHVEPAGDQESEQEGEGEYADDQLDALGWSQNERDLDVACASAGSGLGARARTPALVEVEMGDSDEPSTDESCTGQLGSPALSRGCQVEDDRN